MPVDFKDFIATRVSVRLSKTSRNPPQNGGVDICFMRIAFWVGFKPILENRVFRAFWFFKPVSSHENVNQDFQFCVPFLYIKRHQKNTQAKVFEKLPYDNTPGVSINRYNSRTLL